MTFLEKEEKRLNDCLEMHEKSAKLLKEDISAIRKIREQLLRQYGFEDKACEDKTEEEREMAADKIKMLADEIYQQCVEEKMSCHDFGLLAALINQHKASAFSIVRCQMDELPLPSRN